MTLYYINLIFLHVPKLSWVLSDRSFFGCFKLMILLWYFLFTRKTFLRQTPRYFGFEYKNRAFGLTLVSPVDVAALVEVFVFSEYLWNLKNVPKNILDLGAHWGDTSIYYSLIYPNAKVFAVEPSPLSYKRLLAHSAQFPNIKPIQGAFGTNEEIIDFYLSESSLGNSILERSSLDIKISVQSFSVSKLCEIADVDEFDLIKFDIEGAERFIFCDETIKSRARAFIGEIHLDLISMSIEEIELYFSDFNLELQKINEHRFILRAAK